MIYFQGTHFDWRWLVKIFGGSHGFYFTFLPPRGAPGIYMTEVNKSRGVIVERLPRCYRAAPQHLLFADLTWNLLWCAITSSLEDVHNHDLDAGMSCFSRSVDNPSSQFEGRNFRNDWHAEFERHRPCRLNELWSAVLYFVYVFFACTLRIVKVVKRCRIRTLFDFLIYYIIFHSKNMSIVVFCNLAFLIKKILN